MSKEQQHPRPPATTMASWEDDGGRVQRPSPPADLNALLAQEQRAIMNADAAVTSADHERHRDEARRLRQLVSLTPYPDQGLHVFNRDRPGVSDSFAEDLQALERRVERNDRLLTLQFAAGEVSAKAFQHRSRVVRQDRARAEHGRLAHASGERATVMPCRAMETRGAPDNKGS